MGLKGRLSCLSRALMSPGDPLVLMYHRVANLRHDPWAIAVTPENFRGQMRILSRSRQVVPLSTLLREVSRGRGKGMVSITFDDGYVDIYENALPILSEFGCPATVFLVPGVMDRDRGFWWDELTRILFVPPMLPRELKLPMGTHGEAFSWRTRDGNPNEGSRRSLYYALWRELHAMEASHRETCLGYLSEWALVPLHGDPSDRAMTSAQAAHMARMELIEIGAHTMTHPSLPILSREAQLAEMKASRLACEEIAGHRIDRLAYPFGDHDADTIQAAVEAGFSAAFSTRAGTMAKARNPLSFPRMNIGDFGPDRFKTALALNFAIPDAMPLSMSARLNWATPLRSTRALGT